MKQRDPAPLAMPRWLQVLSLLSLGAAAWLCLYLDALGFSFSEPVRQAIETVSLCCSLVHCGLVGSGFVLRGSVAGGPRADGVADRSMEGPMWHRRRQVHYGSIQ